MHRSAIAALMALAAAELGCPKNEAPPEDDRALRILKGEKEREAHGLPPPLAPVPDRQADDPNAHLAQIASGQDAAEERLPVPKETATVHIGTVAVKLLDLSSSHVAGTGKIRLSTEELFLRVHVITQNVGLKPVPIDFGFAQIESADHRYPVAPDATRVAGTRELKRTYGVDERQDVVLYFELPPTAIGKGAQLVLPEAIGGPQDARIALE